MQPRYAITALLTLIMAVAGLLTLKPAPARADENLSGKQQGDSYTAALPNLLVYPYLGETTTTLTVISWATDIAGASEVRYSLDQSYSSAVAATSNTYDDKYWHSATVTGLTAGSTYYYRVYTSGHDLTPWSEITFTTAPEPTASQFTFAAFGDSRPLSDSSPPSQGALDVAAEMAQHHFDLALHTGDIVYSGGVCSGTNSAWNQYIRAYFDLYRESMGHVPFYPSVGNHELYGGDCGYQGYTDVYHLPGNAPPGDAEEYYSFDWGTAHIIALDTNQDYSAGSAQYNWLVNDLQASTQPWNFVFFHHPAYSSGFHGSTPEVQTHLVPIFETYGVDVVFYGHDHHYERSCPILNGACTTPQDGGIVYYVTGGGGAPLYPAFGAWFTAYYNHTRYHFLKMDLYDCLLRLQAVDTDGNLFDSYEIDRCVAPSPTPTATGTNTPTPTPTGTNTPTPTLTPTGTDTPTLTPTPTPTPDEYNAYEIFLPLAVNHFPAPSAPLSRSLGKRLIALWHTFSNILKGVVRAIVTHRGVIKGTSDAYPFSLALSAVINPRTPIQLDQVLGRARPRDHAAGTGQLC
ncbi:MAG: metallophosphoesterase family protein [Anaerolineae bacterium]|nr:MAG: metallophosphoesterase family protein [Anaerolineae bacterium]